MLAMAPPEPIVQFIFYLIAFVLFLVAFFVPPRFSFIALGLAVLCIPAGWTYLSMS